MLTVGQPYRKLFIERGWSIWLTSSRSRLRRQYPPTNDAHREVLDAYGDALDEMKAELRKPARQVDVVALNRADAAARWSALEYWKLHYPQG